MQQSQQMARDGSQMGGPRSGSPGSGDAPSPKRQRMDDGGFNGQQMGPGGRPQGTMPGQQVGTTSAAAAHTAQILLNHGIDINDIPPQQFNAMQMQPTPDQNKAAQVYSQSLQQQMKTAMNNASNLNKGMPGNPVGLPQGSPPSMAAMDGSNEFYAANGQMRAMPPGGAQNAAANNGNHALQDYQMQLMLLEQQNKKRLLMARQEQDSMAHPAGATGPNGQPFAPNMSPQGSRAGGPSPNPNEMPRGTPKMGKGGVPSPNGDMQARGSPTPGFDPNQQMPPNIRNQMMMAQNGVMRPPPSSHPGFNNGQPMSQPQMEMFARQQAGMLPNGTWPGGPPQMIPGQQQQPQQPPPNMTPQQRNAAMPPPPAPQGDAGRTQPSSPQQPAAPPTPSQSNKAIPKGKKDAKAKQVSGDFRLYQRVLISCLEDQEGSRRDCSHTSLGVRTASYADTGNANHTHAPELFRSQGERSKPECTGSTTGTRPSECRPASHRLRHGRRALRLPRRFRPVRQHQPRLWRARWTRRPGPV